MELDLTNFLVIDIETVAGTSSYQELSPKMQSLWDLKSRLFKDSDSMTSEQLYEEKAGIFAEFGKIVTIAVGFLLYNDNRELSLRVKAYSGHDEAQLLREFRELINKKFDPRKLTFCAHNGKEFDYPYLCRRFLVNGIEIPEALKIHGKKPWEIPHVDTMELWKFGDRKSFTSLDLLASIFNIESSKTDLDGSMVNKAYYEQDALTEIAEYCKRDVIVTAQLFLKLHSLPVIRQENIELI